MNGTRTAWRLRVETSAIHGQGVFAEDSIPAHEPVAHCHGILVGRREFLAAEETTRIMQIGPGVYLKEDPSDPSCDDFLNHSCEPNVGFLDGSLTLYSLRDIAPGQELFLDYSTAMNEPGWAIDCHCRSDGCRGKVRSFCDLSDPEQARLRRIALAYLRTPGE